MITHRIHLTHTITIKHIAHRSEGLPRTGYFIPGRDGMGAGGGRKFFRRRPIEGPSISDHLVSDHLVSDHLISDHLISDHLVSDHLVSDHLPSDHLLSDN